MSLREISEKYVDLKKKINVIAVADLLLFTTAFIYVFIITKGTLCPYLLSLYLLLSIHILSIYFELINIYGLGLYLFYESALVLLYLLNGSVINLLVVLITMSLIVITNFASFYAVAKIISLLKNLGK